MISFTSSRQKMKKEKKTEAADGGDGLPSDLLHCIARRLDFLPDLSSFSMVCKAWRSAGLDARTSREWLRRQSPLLLIPPPADDPRRPSIFFSPPHGRGFELGSLEEELSSKRCIGASRGWLVLLDKHDFFGSPVQLLNTFTGARVALPPLMEADGARQEDLWLLLPNAVLSGDPSSGSCVVMMYQTLLCPFVCRPGMFVGRLWRS